MLVRDDPGAKRTKKRAQELTGSRAGKYLLAVERSQPARRFALCGVLWTSVASLTFAWELSSAIGGREAFMRRFAIGGTWRLGAQLAIVAITGLLWAVLALRLKSDAPAIAGHRRLQWSASTVALAFVGYHASVTWVPGLRGHDPGAIYESLRHSFPYYGTVAVYVVGLAALALAWEQALLVFAGTWKFVRRDAALRWYRAASALLAAACFVITMNAVGHWVTGRALFWRDEGDASSTDAPSADAPSAEPEAPNDENVEVPDPVPGEPAP